MALRKSSDDDSEREGSVLGDYQTRCGLNDKSEKPKEILLVKRMKKLVQRMVKVLQRGLYASSRLTFSFFLFLFFFAENLCTPSR